MKTNIKTTAKTLVLLASIALLASCTNTDKQISELQAQIASLQGELQEYKDAEKVTNERLIAFDTLDFKYYTHQNWDRFNESHADDILAIYPDGSSTTGLAPEHIDALKPMFTFAPDTRIPNHPVRFGSGEWTAVIGELEGTFTEPMPIGNGKTIPPTGKKFKLLMATIGKWKDGKMTTEYLFWDNQSFMQQIGLAQ